MQKIFSHSRMVTVTDDWCPCYPENQVEVSLYMAYFTKCKSWNDHYVTKISAWGMDDHGVEIERTFNNHRDAVDFYEELYELYISIPNGVNMHWFIEHGFMPA